LCPELTGDWTSMLSSQARARVVCTCQTSGCGFESFTNEYGDIQPGRLVSPATRTLHRKKDKTSEPLLDISSHSVCPHCAS
jgi:hypothetical protein